MGSYAISMFGKFSFLPNLKCWEVNGNVKIQLKVVIIAIYICDRAKIMDIHSSTLLKENSKTN